MILFPRASDRRLAFCSVAVQLGSCDSLAGSLALAGTYFPCCFRCSAPFIKRSSTNARRARTDRLSPTTCGSEACVRRGRHGASRRSKTNQPPQSPLRADFYRYRPSLMPLSISMISSQRYGPDGSGRRCRFPASESRSIIRVVGGRLSAGPAVELICLCARVRSLWPTAILSVFSLARRDIGAYALSTWLSPHRRSNGVWRLFGPFARGLSKPLSNRLNEPGFTRSFNICASKRLLERPVILELALVISSNFYVSCLCSSAAVHCRISLTGNCRYVQSARRLR